MPVWNIRSVDEVPEDELSDWAIYELPNGDRHLVGWSRVYREGRATSVVVEFDVHRMRAVTRSGRVYELRGRPGIGLDAEYVWRSWCHINHVDPAACRDVSRQLAR
ncbi:MAG: hypothetical protein JSR75_19675 [Proteobacteria bacterium]|nr:hypothetical protein [Pseudomonadota bacterium]